MPVVPVLDGVWWWPFVTVVFVARLSVACGRPQHNSCAPKKIVDTKYTKNYLRKRILMKDGNFESKEWSLSVQILGCNSGNSILLNNRSRFTVLSNWHELMLEATVIQKGKGQRLKLASRSVNTYPKAIGPPSSNPTFERHKGCPASAMTVTRSPYVSVQNSRIHKICFFHSWD